MFSRKRRDCCLLVFGVNSGFHYSASFLLEVKTLGINWTKYNENVCETQTIHFVSINRFNIRKEKYNVRASDGCSASTGRDTARSRAFYYVIKTVAHRTHGTTIQPEAPTFFIDIRKKN